jgi:hypothetical protein
MKKQPEILTKTLTGSTSNRIQLIFLVIIATIFYRNYSNRRLPSGMPPNTLGLAKQALQSAISESEKLVSKLANFFYNFTGESFNVIFQFLAIAVLIVVLVVAVVYIIRTH